MSSYLRMRKSKFILFSIVIVLANSATAFPQVQGLTLDQVITAIVKIADNSDEKKSREILKTFSAEVRKKRISFAVSDFNRDLFIRLGATPGLINLISENSQPYIPPKPVVQPTPQDHIFFQKRGDANFAKGDLSGALADYDKAAGMIRPSSITILLNRGRTNYGLNNFAKAVSDLDILIAMDPTNASAYHIRGLCFEKESQMEKAIADLRKAADLAPISPQIAADLTRLTTAKDAAAAEAAVIASQPKLIRQAAANYPKNAKDLKIEGQVPVEVSVDAKGKVVSATALSGNAMLRRAAEDAARKSKFEAAKVAGKPVGGKITLTYKFP